MAKDITNYISQLTNKLKDDAYQASDLLARIGGKDVLKAMVPLLQHENLESRFLAARTLGLLKNNVEALEPMLEAINKKDNARIMGDLVAQLEGFDISNSYVEVFKLYLFGSFKTSLVAKELLDFKEFNITPRVLKKATKHWNHYCNNVKQDDVFALKKEEVEEILDDIKDYLED